MILTVTPNPSVDRTVRVEGIARGAVNRAQHIRVDPGGKGVNVSRALTAHGTPTTALLPLGGPEGHVLRALLVEAGVNVVPVPIAAATRSNIAIIEPDGTTTKVNEPGPALQRGEQQQLFDAALLLLDEQPDWLVCSGSLPPGVDPGFYAELVIAAHERGVPVAVDTTGQALVEAAAAGADLLKPNEEELANATARRLRTLGDVVAAAEQLRSRHAQVVVSLGARGALLVTDGEKVLASVAANDRTPVSTVGAGDSLLAGYLHAGTHDAAALGVGVAWGTAAVYLPGSQMPGPAEVAGIQVALTNPPPATQLLTTP